MPRTRQSPATVGCSGILKLFPLMPFPAGLAELAMCWIRTGVTPPPPPVIVIGTLTGGEVTLACEDDTSHTSNTHARTSFIGRPAGLRSAPCLHRRTSPSPAG